MIDGIAGRSTSYEYDLAGRNVASTVTDTSEYDLVASGTTSYADGTGLVDKQTTTIYGANNTVAKHLTYLYGYGTPTSSAGPEAISGLAVNGEQYLYSYDTLGRLITRKTSIGAEDESLSIYQQTNTGKREEYTYVNNSDGTTTTLVKSFRDMLGVLHTYEYDGNGNITSEVTGDVNSPDTVKTYKYDEQNRLTRYNDSELNITYIYDYDARGNITYIKEYVYTTASDISNLIPTKTTPFSYGNTTWRDLLTNINGTTITYDSIGNPIKWTDNRTLTWENGRQLKTVAKNGSGTVYMYNGDGLRTEKWGDRTTQYIILDGTYLGEKTTFYGGTTYLITYIYGAEGSVIGLDVNGTAYYFVKNLQGDVTSIIDVNGNILANYSYDAYGYSMGVTDGNGNEVTSATHIANLNPFRYRGYMYDQETGFYYLTSRYYDPAVCRFLNADGAIAGVGGDINGYNQFAYCFNNPVNMDDTSGNWPKWLEKAAVVASVVVAVAAVVVMVTTVTAVSAGTAAPAALMSASVFLGAALSGINGGVANASKGNSYLNGYAGGAVGGAIQGACSKTTAGVVVGGVVGVTVGTAVTDTLNNIDPDSADSTPKEIVTNAVTSGGKALVTSSLTASVSAGVGGVDVKTGQLYGGVENGCYGLMPTLTFGFGEGIKAFFGWLDDACVYLWE